MAQPSPLVKDVPRDPTDRDRLREEWRRAALEYNRADDEASRFEEGRKLLLDQLTLALVEQKVPVSTAEKQARTSEQFRNYLRKMHDARRRANDLRVEAENKNRIYFDLCAQEATDRAERRMAR